MKHITAPYNFVPLSPHVFLPDWGQADPGHDDVARHDRPFPEGVCGTLDYEIEALGPLFVRGAGSPGGQVAQQSFRTPDGRFAIPGSSVRGMLRTVVQIASFGKLGPINDARFGFRDLHNPQQYVRHMAAIDNTQRGSAAVVPKVGAAWLVKADAANDDGGSPDTIVAYLHACSFAKVEYGHLRGKKPGFDPGKKQSAPTKYGSWGGTPLEVRAQLRGAIGKHLRPGLGEFSIVDRLDDPRGTPGTLVFTGQPQEQRPGTIRRGAGQPKHHDFFFYERQGDPSPIPVTRAQLRDFEFIHSDTGQQGRLRSSPNEEWKHWHGAFEHGRRVPVFYLLHDDAKRLRSFGLAMMFRLAYRHSVAELADAQQPARRDRAPDLAELLFGVVPDRAAGYGGAELHDGIKGRVSIGLATAPQAKPMREVVAVLGVPKPTFYPNYLEQGELPGAQPRLVDGKPVYKTYDDATKAQLRGWKRYRPQEAILEPTLPVKVNENVKTRFAPLAPGARFSGRIRVHNLHLVELGALLWAIDFGERGDREHMIGMARSLGFGRVRLTIKKHDLRRNDRRGAGADPDLLAAARQAFLAWARAQAEKHDVPGGWEGSAQITQLLACATPLPRGSLDGRHLNLSHPVDGNEFVLAKKNGLALGPAEPWKPPPKQIKPPPPKTVRAQLTFAAGRGEWEGSAQIDGKNASLFGKQIEGITDDMTKRRKTGLVTVEVESTGGNHWRIRKVTA